MVLMDRHGNITEVCIGLVDSDGLFLTLLQDADTPVRHYKYASEEGLERKLSNENKRLTKLVDAYEAKVEKLEKQIESLETRNKSLTQSNDRIRKKLANIQKAANGV